MLFTSPISEFNVVTDHRIFLKMFLLVIKFFCFEILKFLDFYSKLFSFDTFQVSCAGHKTKSMGVL